MLAYMRCNEAVPENHITPQHPHPFPLVSSVMNSKKWWTKIHALGRNSKIIQSQLWNPALPLIYDLPAHMIWWSYQLRLWNFNSSCSSVVGHIPSTDDSELTRANIPPTFGPMCLIAVFLDIFLRICVYYMQKLWELCILGPKPLEGDTGSRKFKCTRGHEGSFMEHSSINKYYTQAILHIQESVLKCQICGIFITFSQRVFHMCCWV